MSDSTWSPIEVEVGIEKSWGIEIRGLESQSSLGANHGVKWSEEF